MEIPPMISAVTPESAPGEQELHFVLRENGTALCGMVGLLTEKDTSDAWWSMSEERAFRQMYASCILCYQRHRELVEQWADAKWPNRYKAVPS